MPHPEYRVLLDALEQLVKLDGGLWECLATSMSRNGTFAVNRQWWRYEVSHGGNKLDLRPVVKDSAVHSWVLSLTEQGWMAQRDGREVDSFPADSLMSAAILFENISFERQ